MRGTFFNDKAGIVLSLASGVRQCGWKILPSSQNTTSWTAFCWSKLFQISREWECLGQTRIRSPANIWWWQQLLYLAQTARRPQRSVMKFSSEISFPKTGVYRPVQRHKFHPYVIRGSLYVTINTTWILCNWSNVLQLHYIFRSETVIRCLHNEQPSGEDILQINIKKRDPSF